MNLSASLFLLACVKTEPASAPVSTSPVATPLAQQATPVEAPAADAAVRASSARARLANDANDAAAHYELALALAELRTQAAPCEHGASMDAVLDHLVLAVQGDPALRESMRSEARFSALHTSLRYRLLDQGGAGGARDLKAVFSGLVLWGPPAGIWGSSGSVTLREDGSAAVVTRVLGDAGPVDQAQPDGSWTAGPGPLRLTIGSETQQLTIGEGGALRDAAGPRWYDAPSECSA